VKGQIDIPIVGFRQGGSMRLHPRYFIRGRIAGAVAFTVLSLSGVRAQSQTVVNSVPEWQTAAGGKQSFDVASIKLANPDKFTPPNFALDDRDSITGVNPHGHFAAQLPLEAYIRFAYKLFPYAREQRDIMLAHAPKWVSSDDSYVINAQAEGHPTKDQMRLMLQSLLADRFKLAVHFERRDFSVIPCGLVQAVDRPNNSILAAGRNLTMEEIAQFLSSISISGNFAHPVVDQTGLAGRLDFSLQWTRQTNNTVTPDPGTSMQEALEDQLGLKLKSTKAFMDNLVIDHVEKPSEN
jgi:hypothetical protein